jgi:hypothetical protein
VLRKEYCYCCMAYEARELFEECHLVNCMFHPRFARDRGRMEEPAVVNISCNASNETWLYDCLQEVHMHHSHNEVMSHATGEHLFEIYGAVFLLKIIVCIAL